MDGPQRWPTRRVSGYVLLSFAGLVGALVAGRPEPVVLVTPFVLTLAAGFGFFVPPPVRVAVRAAAERAVEGDVVEVEVDVVAGSAVEQVEVVPLQPPGLTPVAVRLDAGRPTTISFSVTLDRWGLHRVGPVAVRSLDPLHLYASETIVDAGAYVRVHPGTETMRQVVEPAATQVYAGNQRARVKGEGIEFADLRPYVSGDRASSVNWRATARRGELWVNDHHPERNTEVVLLLDAFGESDDARLGALGAAVRAVASLAGAYQGRRDRVGLLAIGGDLRWLRTGTGAAHLYRIVEALLDTEQLLTNQWASTRVPVRALPPQALVLAVTPLTSDTVERTLVDLRHRGYDIAVLSVPAPGAGHPADEAAVLAGRLGALQRDGRRLRLERLGVAVAHVDDGMPIEQAVREVTRSRRRIPRVRA